MMSVAFIAVKSGEDKKAVTNFDVNAPIIIKGIAQTQSNNGMLVLRRGICVSISSTGIVNIGSKINVYQENPNVISQTFNGTQISDVTSTRNGEKVRELQFSLNN